jgi:transposase
MESAMPKSRPPYPPQLRREILSLVRSGRSPEDLAREYEPSATTIRNWMAQEHVDQGRHSEALSSSEREELVRLRRELRSLREEREILKKAAAWFAREAVRPRSSGL